MQHYNEHELELFVLGVAEAGPRGGDIQAHLGECSGCASLVESMREFYARAEKELEEHARVPAGTSLALRRSPRSVARMHASAESLPFLHGANGDMQRPFMRRHPFAAGVGSVAILAAMVAGIFFVSGRLFRDANPSYVHMNPESARLEVYNRENSLLWSVPSGVVYRTTNEAYAANMRRIVVADVDGDGRSEMLTTLPWAHQQEQNALTVFSSDGDVKQSIVLQANIRFRGVSYAEKLFPDMLLVDSVPTERRQEIFLSANNGRSPNILYRLGRDCRIAGAYYHFGNVMASAIGSPRPGESSIAVFGENDSPEPDSLPFPVLILLDPSKITGESEATDARGFGLPASAAEHYIVRFPLSDLNLLIHSKGNVQRIRKVTYEGRDALSVVVSGDGGTYAEAAEPHFEYVFSTDMRCLEVKFDSATMRLRNQLLQNGQITGQFDEAYRDNLMRGIRYWDGSSWVPDPVRVGHISG